MDYVLVAMLVDLKALGSDGMRVAKWDT